jgi:hypothetical protein
MSLWKAAWSLLRKLEIELSYDLSVPLLGMSLSEMKSVCQRDVCSTMFIVPQFTIAKI